MPTVVVSRERADVEPLLEALPPRGEFIMRNWLLTSSDVWVGIIHGEIVGCWGVVPMSVLSFTGYLWLYHTPAAEKNKFLFVRHSQMAIEEMFKQYDLLIGHVKHGAMDSKRWLKWLGAEITRGNLMDQFEIRKRNG